jgi:hypothetical protein
VANFATPASFAKVENNTTFLSPELPIIHPDLGIAGVRVTFNQPLVDLVVGYEQFLGPTTWLNQFFAFTGPSATWPLYTSGSGAPPYLTNGNYIDLNPSLAYLGGPLSTIASRYLKYRFNHVTVTYTTAVGTNQPGSFGLCIIDDPGSASDVATSFNASREITPNVIAPYRIPEAALRWESRDKQVYFVENPDYTGPGNPGSVPDARQTIQATIAGFDSGILWAPTGTTSPPAPPPLTAAGYLSISGDIEFYEPIPPTNVPATAFERLVVAKALARVRGTVPKPAQRCAPRPFTRARPSDAPVPISDELFEEFFGEQECKSSVDVPLASQSQLSSVPVRYTQTQTKTNSKKT